MPSVWFKKSSYYFSEIGAQQGVLVGFRIGFFWALHYYKCLSESRSRHRSTLHSFNRDPSHKTVFRSGIPLDVTITSLSDLHPTSHFCLELSTCRAGHINFWIHTAQKRPGNQPKTLNFPVQHIARSYRIDQKFTLIKSYKLSKSFIKNMIMTFSCKHDFMLNFRFDKYHFEENPLGPTIPNLPFWSLAHCPAHVCLKPDSSWLGLVTTGSFRDIETGT